MSCKCKETSFDCKEMSFDRKEVPLIGTTKARRGEERRPADPAEIPTESMYL